MSLRRAGKVWLASLLFAGLLYPAFIAQRAYRWERACFRPSPREPRLGLSEFGVPDLREVSIRGEQGALRGYFAPSKNGAAVVLAHGTHGERSDLQAEAKILSEAGYGVLAFDFPGHGLSEGSSVTWSAGERGALQRAVSWVAEQPSVEPQRIGAFGFSMGGYIVLQTATVEPRLGAVAAASSPDDPLQHLAWEYREHGFLSRWPALLALRQGGMDTETLVPARVISRISPRPILLIAGDDDQQVPRWMTERLFAAAREPKQLLFVPRAGHGGFAAADPQHYPKQLVDFFSVLLR